MSKIPAQCHENSWSMPYLFNISSTFLVHIVWLDRVWSMSHFGDLFHITFQYPNLSVMFNEDIYQPLSETKCRCTYITYSIVEYVYTVYIYIYMYTYICRCVYIGVYLYICVEYLHIILWQILHILCFQPHILHAWASSWLCFSICPNSRKFSF